MRVSDHINAVPGIETKRYLELGCYDGRNFRRIKAAHKVGVDSDPRAFSTHCMTTDAFFSRPEGTFDIVFIDADHVFESVLADFDNSCRVLAPDGIIFVHDLVPPDETYATREPSRPDGKWCGDGYRLLDMAREQDVEFLVLDEPYGLTRFDEPRPLGS